MVRPYLTGVIPTQLRAWPTLVGRRKIKVKSRSLLQVVIEPGCLQEIWQSFLWRVLYFGLRNDVVHPPHRRILRFKGIERFSRIDHFHRFSGSLLGVGKQRHVPLGRGVVTGQGNDDVGRYVIWLALDHLLANTHRLSVVLVSVGFLKSGLGRGRLVSSFVSVPKLPDRSRIWTRVVRTSRQIFFGCLKCNILMVLAVVIPLLILTRFILVVAFLGLSQRRRGKYCHHRGECQ